jgi:hypothetical protein
VLFCGLIVVSWQSVGGTFFRSAQEPAALIWGTLHTVPAPLHKTEGLRWYSSPAFQALQQQLQHKHKAAEHKHKQTEEAAAAASELQVVRSYASIYHSILNKVWPSTAATGSSSSSAGSGSSAGGGAGGGRVLLLHDYYVWWAECDEQGEAGKLHVIDPYDQVTTDTYTSGSCFSTPHLSAAGVCCGWLC